MGRVCESGLFQSSRCVFVNLENGKDCVLESASAAVYFKKLGIGLRQDFKRQDFNHLERIPIVQCKYEYRK